MDTLAPPAGVSRSTRAGRFEWLAVAAVSVLGGALVWWSTGIRGMALTSDSVSYLSTAENIVSGRGFGSWQQMPLTHWPLGYPVLLAAVAKVTGLSVIDAGRVVGVGIAVGTTLTTWRLSRRVVSSLALRLIVVVAVALGVATVGLQNKLLTDSAFTLVALLELVCLLHVIELRDPRPTDPLDGDRPGRPTTRVRWWLAAVIALVWTAFLLRYQGVLGAFLGAFVLALFPVGAPRVVRLRSALVVGLGGLALPAVYLARSLSGFRSDQGTLSASHPLLSGLSGVPSAFAEWAVGRKVPSWLVAGGVVLLVGLAAAAVVVAVRVLRDRVTSPEDVALAVLGCYWLAALALLVVLRFAIYFDIDSRTLNMLYPLLVVFATALVDRLPAGVGRWAATAAAVVWCLVVVRFGVRSAQGVRRDGSGLTASGIDPTYRDLRAADITSRVPADCALRTNAPDVLFLAGVEATAVHGPGDPAENQPVCVVWIDDVGSIDPVSVDRATLVATDHLVPAYQGSTFTIYEPAADRH
jgi:hypothetical protein